MFTLLANQDISIDNNILSQSSIENIEIASSNVAQPSYIIITANQFEDIEQYKLLKIDDPIKSFFLDKYDKLLQNIKYLNDKFFQEENIQNPNDNALGNAFEVIRLLSDENIYPERINATVEEGICLKFKNKNQILYLEIYNTGELGYIIEDTTLKKIIENEDEYSFDILTKRIKDFFQN